MFYFKVLRVEDSFLMFDFKLLGFMDINTLSLRRKKSLNEKKKEM